MNDDRSKSRRRQLIAFGLFVSFVLFVVFWFFIPPTTNTQPVSLQKDAQGNWQEIGAEQSATGFDLEAHAGSLKSTNNVSTGTVTTHTSPGYFVSRHLMILNPSDHLLMRRIGDGLIKELRDRGTFDRVDYFPHGHDPPIGDSAPDLYVVLGLDTINESGLLSKELKATVVFTLGTAVAHSNYSVSDSYSPPTLNVHAHSSVDHTSTATGVESSAAKYRLQGADISKRIGKTIAETVNGLRENHAADVAFPKSLFPDWKPPSNFDFLQEADFRMMTSLHGLCFHNETFWEILNVQDLSDVIGRVHEELSASGWAGEIRGESAGPPQPLRMTKDSEVLEVFAARDNAGFGSSVVFTSDESKAEPTPGLTVYIRYRNSMSEAARHEAFEGLLADERPDMKQLIALKRLGSSDQQQRLLELIKDSPPQVPEAWMMMARHYAGRKQIPELEQALRNAYVLSWCLGDTTLVDSPIKSLCRKYELDQKAIQKVDFERLSSLGLPTVTAETPLAESTIRVGESSIVLVAHEGDWQVVSVRLNGIHENSGRDYFDTTVSEKGLHGGSSSTRSGGCADEQVRSLTFGGNKQAKLMMTQVGGDSLSVRVGIEVE